MTNKTTGKIYQKPEVTKVKLVPEEALFTGCKMLGTVDTGNTTAPVACHTPASCMLEGT